MHSTENAFDRPSPGYSRGMLLLALAVFLLYAGLRLVSWHNTVLLADTDSMTYLTGLDAFYTWDWNEISQLNADHTPFYPALGSLAKLLTGDSQAAAELVSFIFSLILVVAIGLLAREWGGNVSALLAMLVLAINGMMIELSVAVLTEISYIAVIYVGFYILWRQLKRLDFRLRIAIILGFVFGLAFLNRIEGLLYVIAVPATVFLLGFILRARDDRPAGTRFVAWNVVYILVFLVLITPQILHVSNKMGALAINGRVAWMVMWNAMPDRSSNATTFGLDFADDEVNVHYIRSNYREVREKVGSGARGVSALKERLKGALRNFDRIYRSLIGDQVTPLGFTMAVVGLVAMFQFGNYLAVGYATFLAIALLAGPLVQPALYARHFSALIPLLCVLQGVGIKYTAEAIAQRGHRYLSSFAVLVIALTTVLVAAQMFPLKEALTPMQQNKEYDPEFLAEPIKIINARADISRIAAQRRYIAYFSGIDFVDAPYTDYDKMVCYLLAKNVDTLYVDFQRLAEYPYIKDLRTDKYRQDFERIWIGSDNGQPRAALFKVNSNRRCGK